MEQHSEIYGATEEDKSAALKEIGGAVQTRHRRRVQRAAVVAAEEEEEGGGGNYNRPCLIAYADSLVAADRESRRKAS